jgi:hypothetical protein
MMPQTSVAECVYVSIVNTLKVSALVSERQHSKVVYQDTDFFNTTSRLDSWAKTKTCYTPAFGQIKYC